MTNKLRFMVLERDGFSCKSCGRNPREHKGCVLQVDHIVAIDNGGKTVLNNLQALCEKCNSGKSNKTVEQMELWST